MILFLYGSLRNDQLRDIVFADTLGETRIEQATAHHFNTYRYPGESFPVLLPENNSHVNGIVLFNPGKEALERMAFFEGDEYEIADIEVALASGEKIMAQYNKALELEGLVFNELWRYEHWQEEDSNTLIQISKQYMERCWGIMDVAAADDVWHEIKQNLAQEANNT